jgi:hypothetical protein
VYACLCLQVQHGKQSYKCSLMLVREVCNATTDAAQACYSHPVV